MSHDGQPADPPTPVECSEALLRVFEYLDGEMSDDDTAKIRGHLDTCADCLQQYDLDQMVKLLVKRSCTTVQAPVTLRTTIVRQLTVLRFDEG